MKRFTALFRAIDASTSTLKKTSALVAYFNTADPDDAAWAAYFLAGGKPRQVVPTAVMRELARKIAGIDEWLFDESYAVTGDLAEAIAYVLPPPTNESNHSLSTWVEQHILPMREMDRDAQCTAVQQAWDQLDADERFIFVKLIGGGFRVGVSKLTVQKALARHSGLDAKVIAQRMMGYTDSKLMPNGSRYLAIISTDPDVQTERGQPYPFFLAHQLDIKTAGVDNQTTDSIDTLFTAALGTPTQWLVEWKYDGIRAQVVRRDGDTWIWTRGEELATERFPEVVALATALPDGTVLDGEILAWLPESETPAPFGLLQRRISRKTLGRKILAEAPVTFIAYDILEHDHIDIRAQAQWQRRERLEVVTSTAGIRISPRVSAKNWQALANIRSESRARQVEGLMLKHCESTYGTGRTRRDGTWWKWKVDPLTVDCVLTYAQAGHGRRANVYTDYTFAVWNRTPKSTEEVQAAVRAIEQREAPTEDALQLVTFAKAYSGLTDEEFKAVDKTIRKTTIEKFGPVRSVVPGMVFELGFEGLNLSTRHKSGVATRFPRMLRRREDKPLQEIDTLQSLRALIEPEPQPPVSDRSRGQ